MKGKLLGVVFLVLAVAFLCSGISSSAEHSTLGGIVLCVVFGFLGIRKLVNNSARQKRSDPQTSEGPQPHFVNFRVAGVTFDNDDGTNRQNIIADIDHQRPPFQDADNLEVSVLKTSYEGKLAYEVRVNDVQIGFVPSKQVDEVAAALQHPDARVSGFSIDGGSDGYNYGVGIAIKYMG